MSSFDRPDPAIDAEIQELPEGETHRVKLIGSLVNISGTMIIVNDGTGQVSLNLGAVPSDDMEIGKLGRFIAEVTRTREGCTGNLIGWNEATKDQVKQYRRLVKIERRVPK